ncbi:MAG TPA: hypothetical protein DCE56_13350 [Cyanobacteria bacterium UBA8553]|nr:hypothetical protein [Cyanobacteria bacterium UBA8553]HAJ58797.1 hypothetical protein [Cyanobacteria bacterium UBA8543]
MVNQFLLAVFLNTTTTQPSQHRSSEQVNQISDVSGGLFVVLLLMSYCCIGFWYRGHRKRQVLARIQRTETLERIWKLK